MFDTQMLDMLLLILIIAGSLGLFIWDKLPIDGVAFLVLLSLLLTRLVPPEMILDGFSNSATMTVAAMFILSAGLQRTGIVRYMAHQLYRFVGSGQNPVRLSVVMGGATGVLSAFINNTATVSVLLPVTLRLCRERKISPTKVLMLLSFTAQFGGVCTLIGTTTNLLVNAYAVEAGLKSFSLFEFGKLGIICFGVGLVYMLIVSHFFIPSRVDPEDAVDGISLKGYITEMRILAGSPLIDQTGEENILKEISEDLEILEIIRNGRAIWASQNMQMKEGDIILISGSVDRVLDAMGRLKLYDWAEDKLAAHQMAEEIALMEVLVSRNSGLVGRTLKQMDFYWKHHAAVIAIKRQGEQIKTRLSETKLQEGDMLLLQGHKDDIKPMEGEKDFVFLQDLSTMKVKKRRAWRALFWMMVFLMAVGTGVLPVISAAFLAVAGMVMGRCLNIKEAYAAIDLRVVMLLAGLIPLGLALQITGTADIIASMLINKVGDLGSTAVLAAVYATTMILTAIMSNTATAALLAPLSIGLAHSMGVNPEPFLVAVAFAASTCFTTPVGYQTNMMVYAPGGYKYSDFVKVGLPLNIIFMLISLVVIPYFWPF